MPTTNLQPATPTAATPSARKIRRRPRGQQESDLKRPEVRILLGAAKVRQEEKRLAREKGRLYGRESAKVEGVAGLKGGLACSHAWADANWYHGEAYPPGGDQTLMVRCNCCGALVPPQNVGSSGGCDDCRFASMSKGEIAGLASSRGCVIDMGKLKASRRRGEAK